MEAFSNIHERALFTKLYGVGKVSRKKNFLKNLKLKIEETFENTSTANLIEKDFSDLKIECYIQPCQW